MGPAGKEYAFPRGCWLRINEREQIAVELTDKRIAAACRWTTHVDRSMHRRNREIDGRFSGIPHLAKNERDAPNFLYAGLEMAACAPFFKERRMRFAKPTKFHRKSGMWGTRPSSGNQRHSNRQFTLSTTFLMPPPILSDEAVSAKS